MLIFAASDKGGTGRSVTSCNIVYRRALAGNDVCYVDFDFGSPTAGSIFQVAEATMGVGKGGLHSYLFPSDGRTETLDEPIRLDVWRKSIRTSLQHPPAGAGRLVLFPGDRGGGEFQPDKKALDRCVELFARLDQEFDLCLVDLSAGRSYATEMALAATAERVLSHVDARWLVFHRWTRQHIPAAAGLAFGSGGILDVGTAYGHDEQRLRSAIRFVRTAVVDPASTELRGLRPAQIAWLQECNQDLRELAARHRIGRSAVLGSVPLDPVLQWREQVLTDHDVYARGIANRSTTAAFDDLAIRLMDPWELP